MCIVEREEFSLGNKLSRKSNQVRLMTIIINKKTTITTKNAIGTLVNTDTKSKLTIRSSGFTRRDSNIRTNWKEILHGFQN